MGRDGAPRTDTGSAPEWLDARHRRILAWAAFGTLVEGGLAGLTVLCFTLGAGLLAAVFALALVVASPLMLVGPAQDWWRHRRPYRRRHHSRPGHFPGS